MGKTITGGGGVVGTITAGVSLSSATDNPLLITAGALGAEGTIVGATYGIYGNASRYWTITNNGTVQGTAFGSAGISLAGGGMITNATSGGVSGSFYGIDVGASSSTSIINNGVITGKYKSGIVASSTGLLRVTNSGSIGSEAFGSYGIIAGDVSVTNSGLIAGHYGAADVQGGTIVNTAGGRIIANPFNFNFGTAIQLWFNPFTATNAGTIGSTNGSAISNRYANPGITFSLTNTGSIYGTNATALNIDCLITITNAGTISSSNGVAISLGAHAAGTIGNSGRIAGGVLAGAGVVLSNTGAVTGSIATQGSGTLRVDESPGATLAGAALSAGGGAVQVNLMPGSGTFDAASLAGVTTTVQSGGNWTIPGALQIAQSATLNVPAGTSLGIGAGGSIEVDGSATLAMNGVLGGGGVIKLDNLALLSLSGSTSDGIRMPTGGTAKIAVAGNAATAATALGGTITGFSLGDQIDFTGIGAASIVPNGYDLDVTSGATNFALHFAAGTPMNSFTLAADGAGGEVIGNAALPLQVNITGLVQNTVTISTADQNPVLPALVSPTGVILPANVTTSPGLVAVAGQAWTITNQGTIRGSQAVVDNGAGGRINNYGVIGGTTTGIYVSGGGNSITNSGTIAGGVLAAGAGVVLSNTGAVTGGIATQGSGTLRVDEGPGATLSGAALSAGGGAVQVNLMPGSGTFDAASLAGVTTTVQSGGSWTIPGALQIAQSATLNVPAGTSLGIGAGGSIEVDGSATLAVNGVLGGGGVIKLDSLALLSLSGSTSDGIRMLTGGTAKIAVAGNAATAATALSGTITGFSGGDQIDFTGIGAASIVPNGYDLDVTSGATNFALHFAAGTPMNFFTLAADGAGGEVIGNSDTQVNITGLVQNTVTISTADQNPALPALVSSTGVILPANQTTSPGLVAVAGQAWTITNQGTIRGSQAVVDNGAGGRINNYGVIGGTTTGIYASGGGNSITNSGHVYASSGVGIRAPNGANVTNSGSISGGTGLLMQAGGTITNSGVIMATTTNAVVIAGNGDVVNQAGGLISGVYYGVSISGSGSVTNAGQITGVTGVKVGSGAATIINTGLIEGNGGTAVQFAPLTIGNTFVLAPGATVIGTVLGGSGADLSLIAGSGAGTLTGIGDEFRGFNRLDVASQANWTLSGVNRFDNAFVNIGAGGSLTVAGRLTTLGNLGLGGSGTLTTGASGRIEVGGGGTAAAGQIVVDAGQIASGSGTLVASGGIVDNGVIRASGGVLAMAGPVSGSGLLFISPGATLDVQGALQISAVALQSGGGETLMLDGSTVNDPATIIAGFAAGDLIDLTGIGVPLTHATTGTSISITGSAGSAALSFASVFGGVHLDMTHIIVSPDTHGGTMLTYSP